MSRSYQSVWWKWSFSLAFCVRQDILLDNLTPHNSFHMSLSKHRNLNTVHDPISDHVCMMVQIADLPCAQDILSLLRRFFVRLPNGM